MNNGLDADEREVFEQLADAYDNDIGDISRVVLQSDADKEEAN